MSEPEKPTSSLPLLLLPLLHEINTNPLPPLHLPKTSRPLRRASVAVIIRINPDPKYSALSINANSLPHTIDAFFAQDWVKEGSPEVLLIKRAARKGDRWTSHVALPGGKRDDTDKGDEEVAVREAMEEVGLQMVFPSGDLGEQGGGGGGWNCLSVGALPERLIVTAWGRQPIMVLCPYVFIYLPPQPPILTLQISEVASAHWIPLAHLLSPVSSTQTHCAVGERLTRKDIPFGRWLSWIMENTLGQMEFCGISLDGQPGGGWGYYSTNIEEGGGPDPGQPEIDKWWGGTSRKGMVLWGLTHAVLFDILDAIPPRGRLTKRWRYPTFTAIDVKFAVWLFGFQVRKRGVGGLRERMKIGGSSTPKEGKGNFNSGEGGGEAEWLLVQKSGDGDDSGGESVIIGGSSSSGIKEGKVSRPILGEESAVHILMDGYYPTMRKAVWTGLVVRAVFALCVVVWAVFFGFGNPWESGDAEVMVCYDL